MGVSEHDLWHTHRLPLDPAVNPLFSRSTPLLSAEFLWISSPKSDYGISVASGAKHIYSPTHLHISRIKVAQFLPHSTTPYWNPGTPRLFFRKSSGPGKLSRLRSFEWDLGKTSKWFLNGVFCWNSPSKMVFHGGSLLVLACFHLSQRNLRHFPCQIAKKRSSDRSHDIKFCSNSSSGIIVGEVVLWPRWHISKKII